jgi:hypothetical protein
MRIFAGSMNNRMLRDIGLSRYEADDGHVRVSLRAFPVLMESEGIPKSVVP